MDFGDLSDNPFAAHVAARPQRRSIASSVKVIVLVAACLSLTLIVGNLSRKWVAHRLTHGFDSLSNPEKQARLVEIAELGPQAIDHLVQTMADDDVEVARTAYDLLRRAQNDWTVLGKSESDHCHASMVAAMERIAVHLPDDRTGWATSLLQQTLVSIVERKDDDSQQLFRDTTHAMEILSLSDRPGPSILSDQPIQQGEVKRLRVQSQPLPVSLVDSSRRWTDWPPSGESSAAPPAHEDNDPAVAHHRRSPPAKPTSPLVYRSGGRLRPVQPDDPVVLRDVHQSLQTAPRENVYQETALSAADEAESTIRAATHIVDSPVETFDDKSVIHWLASPHQGLRQRAETELTRRGYDRHQLAIAQQIASGDTKTRLALIDSIARSATIDPRPWLVMMLGDENRDVKLRVVSVLATMNDPAIEGRLRSHLVDETDPTVAARIRRVLDLR